MNLRKAFFGYAKEDVQALLIEFKRRMREADYLSKEKDALLLDYQQQIEDYQKKESMINEALKEARNIASTVLQKAESEAQHLMASTEALTDQQLAHSREDIRQLDKIKDEITQHEAIMRQELLKLIEQQRAAIENFDLTNFKTASQNITDGVAESETIIQNSKIRVILPSEVSNDQSQNQDTIPLYSLK